MNFENPTSPAEKEPHFPSLEEIKSEIERLTGNENPEPLRSLEDEKGIYLYEVVTFDEQGDGSVYSYRRSGNYAETKTSVTVIEVAHFIGKPEEGMFVGGNTLSNYDEEVGEWVDEK
ncbi:MAG: hypothetical protein WDN67_04545 [Candidatus Moraniibacteriota bacterium]